MPSFKASDLIDHTTPQEWPARIPAHRDGKLYNDIGLDICVRRTMCNLIRSPDGHEAVGFELCLSVTDHAAYPEYLWRKGAASLGGFEEIGQLSEDQLSGRSIGISTHCLDKIGTEIKGSQSCQTGGRWWQWYLCSKPIRAKEKYTDSWLPGHRCARGRFYCISLYVIVQNPLL